MSGITSPSPGQLEAFRRKATFEFFAKKVLIRSLAGRKRKPIDAIDELVKIERILK